MPETAVCGYQGGVNKDKAYRKLLLRSASFRSLTSAEISRIADVKRVRISLNEMAIVRMREGAISRTSRREQTITDLNRNRHNYDYYSHYRRVSGQVKDSAVNGSLPRIPDPDRGEDAAPLAASASVRFRTGDGTPTRHVTETPRPTRCRSTYKKRSMTSPVAHLGNYEIRGSSFHRPITCLAVPEGDNEPDHAEVVHARPTGNDPSTDRRSATASPPTAADKRHLQCDKMADNGKPLTTTTKRSTNLVPRLGTFAIRCSTTAIGYFGKQPETERRPQINSLSIRLDNDVITDRKSSQASDYRNHHHMSQGVLGLTERNIGMLEKLRREEDQGELFGKKHVSSRVINWIKDRQLHIDLAEADDSLNDDARSSASSPAKSQLSSADSNAQKVGLNVSTDENLD